MLEFSLYRFHHSTATPIRSFFFRWIGVSWNSWLVLLIFFFSFAHYFFLHFFHVPLFTHFLANLWTIASIARDLFSVSPFLQQPKKKKEKPKHIFCGTVFGTFYVPHALHWLWSRRIAFDLHRVLHAASFIYKFMWLSFSSTLILLLLCSCRNCPSRGFRWFCLHLRFLFHQFFVCLFKNNNNLCYHAPNIRSLYCHKVLTRKYSQLLFFLT